MSPPCNPTASQLPSPALGRSDRRADHVPGADAGLGRRLGARQGMIPIIASAYVLMSLITFVAYYLDKRAARLGRPRTPEATLHVLELLGGWPGALLAQRLLRHKNAKVGYQVVFWLIGAVHVAGWIHAYPVDAPRPHG